MKQALCSPGLILRLPRIRSPARFPPWGCFGSSEAQPRLLPGGPGPSLCSAVPSPSVLSQTLAEAGEGAAGQTHPDGAAGQRLPGGRQLGLGPRRGSAGNGRGLVGGQRRRPGGLEVFLEMHSWARGRPEGADHIHGLRDARRRAGLRRESTPRGLKRDRTIWGHIVCTNKRSPYFPQGQQTARPGLPGVRASQSFEGLSFISSVSSSSENRLTPPHSALWQLPKRTLWVDCSLLRSRRFLSQRSPPLRDLEKAPHAPHLDTLENPQALSSTVSFYQSWGATAPLFALNSKVLSQGKP